MNCRSIRRAALLLALALLFAPQPAAQAEWQQASGFRWLDQRCSWGQTWVTNEGGWPWLQSVATIDASAGDFCNLKNWATQPGEAIAVAQDLIAWDARGFEFRCNLGPWNVHDGRQGAQHELWTWWNFNRPCNTNWYKGRGLPPSSIPACGTALTKPASTPAGSSYPEAPRQHRTLARRRLKPGLLRNGSHLTMRPEASVSPSCALPADGPGAICPRS